MDLPIACLLLVAGLAGGVVNAMAGGATLLTFPALLAAGLPPLVANASNAVAVTPGHLVAAVADREKLPPFDRRLLAALAAAFAGGGIGAWLLFTTPERVFTLLVPALIASATLVFAFGRHLQALLPRLAGGGGRGPLLAACSVYGGYFGAGLGVMLLAVLMLTGPEDGRTANAVKNLLSTAVSAVTVVVFTVTGLVRWPPTLVVLAGAVLGGFLGARLVAVLPAVAVRRTVIGVGAAMTVVYAARYWT